MKSIVDTLLQNMNKLQMKESDFVNDEEMRKWVILNLPVLNEMEFVEDKQIGMFFSAFVKSLDKLPEEDFKTLKKMAETRKSLLREHEKSIISSIEEGSQQITIENVGDMVWMLQGMSSVEGREVGVQAVLKCVGKQVKGVDEAVCEDIGVAERFCEESEVKRGSE